MKPNWRHILLVGQDHPEWDNEAAQLERQLREDGEDAGLEDAEDEAFDEAVWLAEVCPQSVRALVNKLLIERCTPKVIADQVYYKLRRRITPKGARLYRKFFFDVDSLDNHELARMGHLTHDAPPVPGQLREAYAAFQAGDIPKLDPDTALTVMFQTSFFRAQELKAYGWAGDDKLLKFQTQAIQAYRTMLEHNTQTELPEAFSYEVEYPVTTTQQDITEYDYDDAVRPEDPREPEDQEESGGLG